MKIRIKNRNESPHYFHTFVRNWWVLLSFIAFYLPLLIIALKYGPDSVSSNEIQFYTSWFNPIEDWDFSPLWGGIELNFFVPAFTILFTEFHSHYEFPTNRWFSVEAAYLFGIISTYIVSGTGWFFSGKAGSGTSIVAFVLYSTYSIKLALDWFYIVKSRINAKRSEDRISGGGLISILMSSVVIYPLFFITLIGYMSNKAMWNHFVGLGIFIIFTLFLFIERIFGSRRFWRNDGKPIIEPKDQVGHGKTD